MLDRAPTGRPRRCPSVDKSVLDWPCSSGKFMSATPSTPPASTIPANGRLPVTSRVSMPSTSNPTSSTVPSVPSGPQAGGSWFAPVPVRPWRRGVLCCRRLGFLSPVRRSWCSRHRYFEVWLAGRSFDATRQRHAERARAHAQPGGERLAVDRRAGGRQRVQHACLSQRQVRRSPPESSCARAAAKRGSSSLASCALRRHPRFQSQSRRWFGNRPRRGMGRSAG